MEHLGPTIGTTLGLAYLARVDGGEGARPRAAALLAHDLRQGDRAQFKAGYSRENAILAALDVFGDVDRDELGEMLDELTKQQRAEEGEPRRLAALLRTELLQAGLEAVGDLEEDSNGPPHGTLEYDWSATAFTVRRDRREFRVVVEETTVEEEA